ncbi:GNAT family N-acetyltransferase [Levilactobacillus tangyuanensis]|uniref:GNAT family N-acetyltransferase n=1 Tax=Levilactobacillus tangyuanensis TaxID=2486021 RepID=A0ABW1TLP5_9LACO|nr:GNAT family N-acetyltransferase [Levilactobacillus tangyuanensis]
MTLTYERMSLPLTPALNDLLLLADPSQRLVDGYLATSAIYAANDRQGLAGVLVLQRQSDLVVEVKNVAVSPAKQRRGYGQALIQFALQWAIEHGYRTVRIATGTTSLTQLYLYQKCGFRVVGVVPDYFTTHYGQSITGNGLPLRDRLILEKTISLPRLPIN